MKITFEGTPKEIAALVLAVQERPVKIEQIADQFAERPDKALRDTVSKDELAFTLACDSPKSQSLARQVLGAEPRDILQATTSKTP